MSQPGYLRLRYPREVRLLHRADFDAVYGAGKRRSSPQFSVFFCSRKMLSMNRSLETSGERGGQGVIDDGGFAGAPAADNPGEPSSGKIGSGAVSCSRFGISVKKALGGAVVRNRIRRRIREILRRNLTEIPSGWDIVIHPRRTAAEAPFPSLEADLLRLLKALKPQ